MADKVFIVGAGQKGKELLHVLKDDNSIEVAGFLDNNEKLIGSYIYDIIVQKPYNAGVLGCIYIIAVDSMEYQKELSAQLSETGIKKENIIIYNHYGAYEYLSTLDEKYYEDEVQEMYYEKFGKKIDWKNLRTYNEKIQWIKLHGVTPLMTRLTDKYAVREWVREQIGEKYLVPLIGVWDSFDNIDIEKLPNRFALKCTHGCMWNEIVRDKKIWDAAQAKKKFDQWMKLNFAFKGALQMQRNILRMQMEIFMTINFGAITEKWNLLCSYQNGQMD